MTDIVRKFAYTYEGNNHHTVPIMNPHKLHNWSCIPWQMAWVLAIGNYGLMSDRELLRHYQIHKFQFEKFGPNGLIIGSYGTRPLTIQDMEFVEKKDDGESQLPLALDEGRGGAAIGRMGYRRINLELEAMAPFRPNPYQWVALEQYVQMFNAFREVQQNNPQEAAQVGDGVALRNAAHPEQAAEEDVPGGPW